MHSQDNALQPGGEMPQDGQPAPTARAEQRGREPRVDEGHDAGRRKEDSASQHGHTEMGGFGENDPL